MHRYWRQRNGWQLASFTPLDWVAARTCASTQSLATTRARFCRFRLFQAGVIERKTAGSVEWSVAYQPMPKPSPFNGSSRSRLCVLWRISEWVGSMISDDSRVSGPRYSMRRHMSEVSACVHRTLRAGLELVHTLAGAWRVATSSRPAQNPGRSSAAPSLDNK